MKKKPLSILQSPKPAANSHIKSHYELSVKLGNSEKELATQKGIVESFQNPDFTRLNDELGLLNKELQGLKASKGRLEKLIKT